MSRLNYLAEEDEALLSLNEDLSIFERHRDAGRSFSRDQANQIRALADRARRLLQQGDWDRDEEPMPSWLQPCRAAGTDPIVQRKAKG